MWLQRISNNKIYDIITKYQLKLYHDIWHYSFQEKLLNQDFYLKKTINGKISLFADPYNQWSPAPLFTNSDSLHKIKSNNIVNEKYNRGNKTKRKIFWFLKLENFTDYLEERTQLSSKPSKHFPTLKNYNKKRNNVNGSMEIKPFNELFFYKHYNALKQPQHYDGEKIFESLILNNPGLPKKWLKMATLSHEEEIVAIFLLIDDGKSISLFNLASKRNQLSFGLVLCTDIIKFYCKIGYYSFDAGVSGKYGTYKDKIFLHSMDLN